MEITKMTSIPHLDQMSGKHLFDFFASDNWEFTEKADGSNVSFGVNDGLIYVKSKRGQANYTVEAFNEIAEKLDLDVFIGFGEFLHFLQTNGDQFIDWYNFVKEHRLNGQDFQIFGELFNNSTMNVVEYSSEKIGNGAVYLFMIKVLNGEDPEDISFTPLGCDILSDFQRVFDNNSQGWNFYNREEIKIDTTRSGLVEELMDFIKTNRSTLISRKRADKVAKENAKQETLNLLSKIKREVLNEINDTHSILGGDYIEGLVVRNLNNGELAKVVDLTDFGEKRLALWAGVDEMKDIRRGLLNNIQSEVLDNADIFVLPKKQKEKLFDELNVRNKPYDNLDEMLDVLYLDAIDERPEIESELSLRVNAFIWLLDCHIDAVKSILFKPEVKNNPDTFEKTNRAVEADVCQAQEAIEELRTIKDDKLRYFSAIKFFIGDKGISDLTSQFLKS